MGIINGGKQPQRDVYICRGAGDAVLDDVISDSQFYQQPSHRSSLRQLWVCDDAKVDTDSCDGIYLLVTRGGLNCLPSVRCARSTR